MKAANAAPSALVVLPTPSNPRAHCRALVVERTTKAILSSNQMAAKIALTMGPPMQKVTQPAAVVAMAKTLIARHLEVRASILPLSLEVASGRHLIRVLHIDDADYESWAVFLDALKRLTVDNPIIRLASVSLGQDLGVDRVQGHVIKVLLLGLGVDPVLISSELL